LKPSQNNYLFCGLIGYSGANKADPMIIKILMMYNIERGKDASGICIDNKIYKVAESAEKFLSKGVLNTNFNNTSTVIAHTRQGSVGIAKIAKNAHPFATYKGDYDEKTTATPEMILAMNGTISNMYNLDKKFYSGYTYGDSDSAHLALMLTEYKSQIKEILNEYEGAATLLYYYTEDKNTLNVWKCSERPLFYWQKSKNEIYISSLEESLKACCNTVEDLNNIHPFEDFNNYVIVSGEIKSKEQWRIVKPKVTNYVNTSPYVSHPQTAKVISQGSISYGYGEYYDLEDSEAPDDTYRSKSFQRAPVNGKENEIQGKIIIKNNEDSELDFANINYSNRYFSKKTGKPLHGQYVIMEKTSKVIRKLKEVDQLENAWRIIYFFGGIMIRNIRLYNLLSKEFIENLNGDLLFKFKHFEALPAKTLSMYTYNPVHITSSQIYMYNGERIEHGDFNIPFTVKNVIITSSHVSTIHKNSGVDLKDAFKQGPLLNLHGKVLNVPEELDELIIDSSELDLSEIEIFLQCLGSINSTSIEAVIDWYENEYSFESTKSNVVELIKSVLSYYHKISGYEISTWPEEVIESNILEDNDGNIVISEKLNMQFENMIDVIINYEMAKDEEDSKNLNISENYEILDEVKESKVNELLDSVTCEDPEVFIEAAFGAEHKNTVKAYHSLAFLLKERNILFNGEFDYIIKEGRLSTLKIWVEKAYNSFLETAKNEKEIIT
jgi:predicted glutamine amidotransferase